MLTEAEMQRYRSALYGVAAAVGHAPRMSLAGEHPLNKEPRHPPNVCMQPTGLDALGCHQAPHHCKDLSTKIRWFTASPLCVPSASLANHAWQHAYPEEIRAD